MRRGPSSPLPPRLVTYPTPTPNPLAVSKDELVREALRALHACTEADKPLSPDNVVIGVVGSDGAPFAIIEGDAAAPFLVAVEGLPRPAAPAAAPADGDADMAAAAAAAPGGAAAPAAAAMDDAE